MKVLLPGILSLAPLIALAEPPPKPAPPVTVPSVTYVPEELLDDKATGEHHFEVVSAKLDAVVKKLVAKLDKAEAAAFARAQAKWVEWREEEAKFLSHRYASTGNAVAAIQVQFEAIKTAMKAQLTEKRTEELEERLGQQ